MRYQWCFRYESKKLSQDSLLPSGESSAMSKSGVTSPDDIDSPVPEFDIPTLRIKKRNIEEHLEKTMIEVVDRIMKAQEASDDKFALLEEKRMRLEEKLLQSEEK